MTKEATFVQEYEGHKQIEAPCLVNTDTNEVFNIGELPSIDLQFEREFIVFNDNPDVDCQVFSEVALEGLDDSDNEYWYKYESTIPEK